MSWPVSLTLCMFVCQDGLLWKWLNGRHWFWHTGVLNHLFPEHYFTHIIRKSGYAQNGDYFLLHTDHHKTMLSA